MLPIEDAARVGREVGVPEELAGLNVFRVLLRRPRLAKAVNDLLLSLLFGAELSDRLRELLIMRIGWTTGSVYEWTQHWQVGLDFGVSESDLVAVRDWQAHAHWSGLDRAVLTATDEVLDVGAVSAETWSRCADLLGSEEQMIELVAAIGTWGMIAQVLRSIEIPLEAGVAPWPPDGIEGGTEP